MESPAKRANRPILGGMAKVSLTLGAFSFLVGGGLIHVLFNVERFLAEVEGIGLSAIFFAAGFLLKPAADGSGDPDKVALPED
jgi:hypothetical protein